MESVLQRSGPLLAHGKAALALADPIMNVMHNIEGHKPYLSRMLPMILAM